MIRIAILGGGGWGTGLAVVLSQSRRPHEIRLWAREAAVVECIQRDHENKIYLPGVPLPESVSASTDLREILNGADILLGVVPSAHARSVFTQALPFVRPEAAIVSATKGLEPATHLRMSELIEQVFRCDFGRASPFSLAHPLPLKPPGASPPRLCWPRTIARSRLFSRKSSPAQHSASTRMMTSLAWSSPVR